MLNIGAKVHSVGWITSAYDAGGQPCPQGLSLTAQVLGGKRRWTADSSQT